MPCPDFSRGDCSHETANSAREAMIKEQLIMKLQDNGLLSNEELPQFKYDAVALFKRWGRRQLLGQDRRDPQRFIEEKFSEILRPYLVQAVVERIEKRVPNDRCIQVYEDIMSVLPRNERQQASTKANPHRNPKTPFSISRATPGSIKSNAQLIDTLASAANLHPATATMLRGQIVWSDSHPWGTRDPLGVFDTRTKLVSCGRLGRDHTLSDVPNNYVRDCLMNFINTKLDESRQENARRAVFSDLTPTEIEQYSTLIMKVSEDRRKTEDEMIAQIAGDKTAVEVDERDDVSKQALALEKVDKNVDLTPKPGFAIRDYHYPRRIKYSVIEPGLNEPTPEEEDINPGTDIDRDCDQIRAMIAIFIANTEWTADQFRLKLSGVDRERLTIFLEEEGTWKGDDKVFELAWEFFKRREMLGLPVAGTTGTNTSEDSSVLQERDANTTKRSSNDSENANATRKRTRRG
ncbi:hypothetical protein F4776DRAFT_324309 [Hypoxylon sp. NC0597]|nr:hypothetical protein F4776DRAFT_324309 [Hypoxylon sp. NC0597]